MGVYPGFEVIASARLVMAHSVICAEKLPCNCPVYLPVFAVEEAARPTLSPAIVVVLV